MPQRSTSSALSDVYAVNFFRACAVGTQNASSHTSRSYSTASDVLRFPTFWLEYIEKQYPVLKPRNATLTQDKPAREKITVEKMKKNGTSILPLYDFLPSSYPTNVITS